MEQSFSSRRLQTLAYNGPSAQRPVPREGREEHSGYSTEMFAGGAVRASDDEKHRRSAQDHTGHEVLVQVPVARTRAGRGGETYGEIEQFEHDCLDSWGGRGCAEVELLAVASGEAAVGFADKGTGVGVPAGVSGKSVFVVGGDE